MRDAIEKRLREGLDASYVEVIDESHLHAGHAGARDGGQHFRATIVSEKDACDICNADITMPGAHTAACMSCTSRVSAQDATTLLSGAPPCWKLIASWASVALPSSS